MAITRYHPPLLPDSRKHVDMTKGRSGAFVLYRDHAEKVKLLKERIAELEVKIHESGASDEQ